MPWKIGLEKQLLIQTSLRFEDFDVYYASETKQKQKRKRNNHMIKRDKLGRFVSTKKTTKKASACKCTKTAKKTVAKKSAKTHAKKTSKKSAK